jgi:hypothetical protein
MQLFKKFMILLMKRNSILLKQEFKDQKTYQFRFYQYFIILYRVFLDFNLFYKYLIMNKCLL